MCPALPQIYSHGLIEGGKGVSEPSVSLVPHQKKFDAVGPVLCEFWYLPVLIFILFLNTVSICELSLLWFSIIQFSVL